MTSDASAPPSYAPTESSTSFGGATFNRVFVLLLLLGFRSLRELRFGLRDELAHWIQFIKTARRHHGDRNVGRLRRGHPKRPQGSAQAAEERLDEADE